MQKSSAFGDVLILGAGPAGMAAAMELSRAGRTVTIVEKGSQVGGLAKTLTFGQPEGTYRTDIGPHRFYSQNRYLYDFIQDLLGEEWKSVPRLTRFYVEGKYYFYPIRFRNVLSQIGIVRVMCMLRDYGWERIRTFVAPRKLHSFEDYALGQFGRTLASFNMLNYTEKIWGLPCSEISVDWANQRIGGLSLWAAVKKMFFTKGGPKTLVDTFYYPSEGSGLIYEAIKKRIEEKGNAVHVNTEPTTIRWSDQRVTEVETRAVDRTEAFHSQNVISSIPITRAIELFDPSPPPEVTAAARHLRFRSQVYLFLTVKREQIVPDNWVYFPDKNIPFGRISEMKNFSRAMCPRGYTSLFVEFFCFAGDEIWQMEKEQLFSMTMDVLERLAILDRTDVTGVHLFRQEHVYPLYDLQYAAHLRVILDWLDRFENFYAIGRPGRFRYTNQDHSLEMGILAAQSVLDGKRRDVDEVTKEKEYFERGFLPERK
ncbi:FAD-dependent oxidoreductase [Candidatus Peregrinibacteria bacterium]|nr:FAD-dependent oxidoreductase [Candidatus Peregrinibacteria bacterium]MBI3816614.1 FAD-dependent oxidoreductase [Candidatus Peregrinibacteria bacterium]